jgi:hypothetical protein
MVRSLSSTVEFFALRDPKAHTIPKASKLYPQSTYWGSDNMITIENDNGCGIGAMGLEYKALTGCCFEPMSVKGRNVAVSW